jgi:hypothetical protein
MAALKKNKMAAVKKPAIKKPVGKTRGFQGNLTRSKVETAILRGKTKKEAAKEAGVSEKRVEQIAAEPDFQERIKARVEAAGNVSDKEVIGTLTEQMRGAVTDVLPDDGGFITELKARGLGHLVKKVKLRREVEAGTKKQFEVVEIEVHSSQSAAAILGKFMGLETMPKQNPVDTTRYDAAIVAYMKERDCSREEAEAVFQAAGEVASKFVS